MQVQHGVRANSAEAVVHVANCEPGASDLLSVALLRWQWALSIEPFSCATPLLLRVGFIRYWAHSA